MFDIMKTIFYGGKVYTGALPLAEAFVVEGDHFIFAGSSADALNMAEHGDNKVDAKKGLDAFDMDD